MNHEEIRSLLTAYIDDELPGSERRLVEEHVADCAACRSELAMATALSRQVRKTLKTRAETVAAPPGGWLALQSRMAVEPAAAATAVSPDGSKNHSGQHEEATRRSPSLRLFSLGFATLAVLIFVWLVIISPLIPGGNEITKRKKTPTPEATAAEDVPTPTVTEVAVEVGAPVFTPLSPSYLPENMAYMNDRTEKDGSRVMTFYNKHGDDFLSITQTGYTPGDPLPDEGTEVMVVNMPARLVTGVKGKIKVGEKNERTINYKDAVRLTWQTSFGTRASIVSNLSPDRVISYARTLAVDFTRFAADTSPFEVDYIVGSGAEGIEAAVMVSESHTYGVEDFVVVLQTADIGGEPLPGEPITLPNDIEAAITRGLSGEASAESHEFFAGRDVQMLGGGGGGGGEGEPPEFPQTIPYTDGVRVVWTQDGTRIEVLSNLPEDKVLAFAASMKPQPQYNQFVTGAYIDRSILPKGGSMAGYVISAPSLPADFYGDRSVTVTEGDGLIIEHRYFSNTQFLVVTTRRDDGSKLPSGDPLTIAGQSGVVQTGQKGTALLNPEGENQWLVTLQDGKPRLIIGQTGGGGVKNATGPEQTYPSTIDYADGLKITWTLDGAQITMVTNLSLEQARAAAESISILGKDFILISPLGGGWQGQLFAEGYDLWGPTYLPESMAGPGLLDQGSSMDSQPGVLFWNPDDPTQFVQLKQRAAKPGEIVGTPLSIVLLGQPVLVEEVSGSFFFQYAMTPRDIDYTNATRITVIVDGTWIQLLTSLPRDEAMKIAESLAKEQ